MNERPQVSIIVPCFNEQGTIAYLLDAISAQDYPLSCMEVIVADGMSTDNTRQIISEYITKNKMLSIKLVDNLQRSIPSGLNRAIESSSGEIVLRLDAHSVPYPDYVSRSVEALQAGLGQVVGGVWDIQPGGSTWVARGIAAAAGHPFGVGDARYRFTKQASQVDTVPFGAYFIKLIQQIGIYDETLLSNEDYEFNARVRQSGGVVWLDPRIRSIYFARSTLSKLARQYWRYGYWKWQMLRRYPTTIRWRQALPPIFIVALLILFLSGFWLPASVGVFLFLLIVYIFVLAISSIRIAIQQKDISLIISVPFAISVMHFCWGTAFLWSLISSIFQKLQPANTNL